MRNTYALELNVFESGIDTDFAIFSFKQPDKVFINIDGNTDIFSYISLITHYLILIGITLDVNDLY